MTSTAELRTFLPYLVPLQENEQKCAHTGLKGRAPCQQLQQQEQQQQPTKCAQHKAATTKRNALPYGCHQQLMTALGQARGFTPSRLHAQSGHDSRGLSAAPQKILRQQLHHPTHRKLDKQIGPTLDVFDMTLRKGQQTQ